MDSITRVRDALKNKPVIGQDVFIAAGARIVGDVVIEDGASIWFNAVLRGDINRVVIGAFTNIQDGSTCHVADNHPCLIGAYNTVGHNVILHGCVVGDENLVGMGAILMNGVRVGNQCLIGAGSLLTEGRIVPDGSLVYGAPANIVSKLDDHERKQLRSSAETYHRLAQEYRQMHPPSS